MFADVAGDTCAEVVYVLEGKWYCECVHMHVRVCAHACVSTVVFMFLIFCLFFRW